MDDPRPIINAIIAWPLPSGHFIMSRQTTVTLDEALAYARMGWEVMTDPFDQEALTRWEMLERSRRHPRRWNRW